MQTRLIVPLAFAATAALGIQASAQDQGAPRMASAAHVNHATYDLATGTWRRTDPQAPETAFLVNEVITIDSTQQSGFYLPTGGNEFVDHGRTVGSSGPVCEIKFAYGTIEPDPDDTGPVTVVLSFYGGDASTMGDCGGLYYGESGRGELLQRRTYTGLPGDSTPGDGIAESWIFTVDMRSIGGPDSWYPRAGWPGATSFSATPACPVR